MQVRVNYLGSCELSVAVPGLFRQPAGGVYAPIYYGEAEVMLPRLKSILVLGAGELSGERKLGRVA